MKRLQVVAVICLALLITQGCSRKNAVAEPGEKLVTISADCTAPDQEISRDPHKNEHIRWTTDKDHHFEVAFSDSNNPCHLSNAPGTPTHNPYDVPGKKSDQCFALADTDKLTYKYDIYTIENHTKTKCGDPAVIVTD